MPLNPNRPDMQRGRDRRYSRARIKIGYACNLDCVFCECRTRRGLVPDLRDLARKVLLARDRGFEQVIFSGGEPTLSPDLPRLTALCAKLGMPFGLVTNGHGLEREDRVRRLVAQGLATVQLSIHGDRPETQAALAQTESGSNPWRALETLCRVGMDLTVNTVLTRRNAEELTAIAGRVAALADAEPGASLRYKVTWMNPATLAAQDWDTYLLPLQQAQRAVAGLFAHVDNRPERFARLRVVAAGLPLCALNGYEDRSFDLRREKLAEDAELFDAAFQRESLSGRIKPALCAQCRHVSECPGLWEAYAERMGTAELRPRSGPVSNSFAYEPVEDWPDFDLHTCPILWGKRHLTEAARSLLIPMEKGVRLYRTDSADFSPGRIRATVQELGQIYMDVSGKLFHEDFATDLRKLDTHPVCVACPKRGDCATVQVEREGENVFDRAEKELLGLFGSLTGRVLDVGGGPVRYADLFGTRIQAGAMDYHVVEPDLNPLLRSFIERHGLSSRLFVGRVEDYSGQPEAFDWILVLRSHNHLYDLPLAYRNMACWLKPGGRILLVDNTVYGVVRQADIWEEIRRQGGTVRFEHYNNHTSREAIPYLLDAGLVLLDDHPVGPETANQWWCLFEKPR